MLRYSAFKYPTGVPRLNVSKWLFQSGKRGAKQEKIEFRASALK